MKLKIAILFGIALLLVVIVFGVLRPSETFWLLNTHRDPSGTPVKASPSPMPSRVNELRIDPNTCKEMLIASGDPEAASLVKATEDAVRECEDRRSKQNEQAAREVEETKKKEELQARRERQSNFEELGHYSGKYQSLIIGKVAPDDGGLILTVRETDVLLDRLIVPVEIRNNHNKSNGNERLKFTLFLSDGSELNWTNLVVRAGGVRVRSDGSVYPPPIGEQGSVALEFARKNTTGRFALAVNGNVAFRLTHYGWAFVPF